MLIQDIPEGTKCGHCGKVLWCCGISICPDCEIIVHDFLCWETHRKEKHNIKFQQIGDDYEYA